MCHAEEKCRVGRGCLGEILRGHCVKLLGILTGKIRMSAGGAVCQCHTPGMDCSGAQANAVLVWTASAHYARINTMVYQEIPEEYCV